MSGPGLSTVTHLKRMLIACGTLLSLSVTAADHSITLPAETAVLKPSELPGYQLALQKCGICHSADYINLQPPHMKLTQWTAEMNKMQRSYGAPIDAAEIQDLAVYFTITYGDAQSVPEPGAAPR
jgi:hypothetical protein